MPLNPVILLPIAACLAAGPVAFRQSGGALPKTGHNPAGHTVEVLVAAVEDSSQGDSSQKEVVRAYYRGIEFLFSKANSVDSCGIEGVEVVEHLPLPRWSVSLRLSDDSARFLVGKDRVLFGVFLDGTVRYVGPWLRWHHNQLDIDCDNREEAYQLAEVFNRAMAASRKACGKEQARFEVRTMVKQPSPNLEPPLEFFSTPPIHCTEAMRESGLKGELRISVVVREDGTVDPVQWNGPRRCRGSCRGIRRTGRQDLEVSTGLPMGSPIRHAPDAEC